ncbi:PmoA family protein [Planctopirus hydrillae]|uniref:Methane oxygenase PmoA n=1 Tax=Planctopirus hydrillae TaxID=1841610 RepID=A0A1C3E721_9PLAN|nr:PmoA family protein [Planctopirus hydrillae]ODA29050.1 hypothetical protein A6X21_10180 [Planctopirus hydrillae]
MHLMISNAALLARGVLAILSVMVCSAATSTAGFEWKTNAAGTETDLTLDGQPVLKYMHAYDPSTPERNAETYKVFHHVFGPGTGDLITKGPGGTFPHHRGMYVAWNKTQTEKGSYDFWHCTKGAHQKHIKFLKQEANDVEATATAEIHWEDADNKPVIREERTVTVKKLPLADGKFGWQIEWSTVLHSERGKIRLTGDRQHAGFQFRAPQSVADANSARYIRPANFPQQPEAVQENDGPAEPKHANLDWCAMTYPVNDNKYTIAYFEDPSLPKPRRFSERPYGRFGSFFETDLLPEEPLKMTYRILVFPDNSQTSESLQKAYDQFTATLKKS